MREPGRRAALQPLEASNNFSPCGKKHCNALPHPATALLHCSPVKLRLFTVQAQELPPLHQPQALGSAASTMESLRLRRLVVQQGLATESTLP